MEVKMIKTKWHHEFTGICKQAFSYLILLFLATSSLLYADEIQINDSDATEEIEEVKPIVEPPKRHAML